MYAACDAIGPKLGIGPETLRRWEVKDDGVIPRQYPKDQRGRTIRML